MRTFLLTWTAATMAFAAEPAARLSSPVLGYVFDFTSKAVRPITGIPGAASLEVALPSASKLENGFVSQNRDWLVAVLLEGGVQLVNLRTGVATPLEGAPQQVAIGAWSSDGSAVALWSPSGDLQVWTGFPDTPELRFSQQVESAAGVAVSDGGHSVLAWGNFGLITADVNGVNQLVGEAVAAATYRPGSSEWAAVTATHLLRSGLEPRALNVEKPAAVAFAKDAMLAGGRGGVEVVSESGGSRLVSCECETTSLDRMAGNDVFRLTGSGAQSLALYDGSDTEPRILYIPTEGGRL